MTFRKFKKIMINLGDRPMSTMGKGAPLDALDAVCKAYKECQKCARQQFGEMCIGEFVRYGLNFDNGSPVCTDEGNSCGRALCECDKKFAQGKDKNPPMIISNKVSDIRVKLFFRACCSQGRLH